MEPFKVTLFSFCAGLCCHVNVPCINSGKKSGRKGHASKWHGFLWWPTSREYSAEAKKCAFLAIMSASAINGTVPLKKGLRTANIRCNILYKQRAKIWNDPFNSWAGDTRMTLCNWRAFAMSDSHLTFLCYIVWLRHTNACDELRVSQAGNALKVHTCWECTSTNDTWFVCCYSSNTDQRLGCSAHKYDRLSHGVLNHEAHKKQKLLNRLASRRNIYNGNCCCALILSTLLDQKYRQ